MLDADGAVVADHAQGREEVVPPREVVAVAAGPENPRAVELVAVVLGVEHAVDFGVLFVHLCIFGVDMEDRFAAERAHGFDWIDALPEEVAGVEIRAEVLAAGIAQPQERFGVVDHEPGMGLEGDFHPVIRGELRLVGPVRPDPFAPLPFQDFEIVGWPGTGHPAGLGGARVRAGTTREVVDDLNAEQFGQPNGVGLDFDVAIGEIRVRVQAIAVAA